VIGWGIAPFAPQIGLYALLDAGNSMQILAVWSTVRVPGFCCQFRRRIFPVDQKNTAPPAAPRKRRAAGAFSCLIHPNSSLEDVG